MRKRVQPTHFGGPSIIKPDRPRRRSGTPGRPLTQKPTVSSRGNTAGIWSRAGNKNYTYQARFCQQKNGTEDAQCRSCHASAAALQLSFHLFQSCQNLLHFPLDIGHFPEAFVEPALGQPL